jgi:hypothetical protein
MKSQSLPFEAAGSTNAPRAQLDATPPGRRTGGLYCFEPEDCAAEKLKPSAGSPLMTRMTDTSYAVITGASPLSVPPLERRRFRSAALTQRDATSAHAQIVTFAAEGFGMASTTILERQIARIRRGHLGCGERADYKPGASVWEDRQAKRVHRVPFMGREAQLPRDCRLAAFLWECYQDNTADIREFMPCDHAETVEVARSLKVRHPRNGDGTCKVLKTDLLVTKHEGRRQWVEAVSVRLQGAGPLAGQSELRIIEQFWKQHGVAWRLHLNDGLNSNWARNLDFLYAIALRPVRAGEGADSPLVQRAVLCALHSARHMSVRTACEFAMKEKGLPLRYGLNAFHLMLAAKHIRFDVHCR